MFAVICYIVENEFRSQKRGTYKTIVFEMMASNGYLKLDHLSSGIYPSLIHSKYLLSAYFVPTGIVLGAGHTR